MIKRFRVVNHGSVEKVRVMRLVRKYSLGIEAWAGELLGALLASATSVTAQP
jgi:hypothetical protein